jgi:hypothetical protein
MDLIYIILSIYIRLFRVAFPLSCSASVEQRGFGSQEWAMWLPFCGWMAVLVRFSPTARWLTWRVTEVRRMSKPRWDAPHRLDKYKPHRRPRKPIDEDARSSERVPK